MSAGRDVRGRRVDTDGQGDHRGAVRAHVLGEHDQPDQREPGRHAAPLCRAAARRGVSVSDAGCGLREVRLDGVIQSQAVFVAIGINWDGRRQVLGVELSNRESRSSWATFVTGLKARGLHGVEFVVSDDHAGLSGLWRSCCPRRSGGAATCMFSGTRSTTCPARPMMTAVRSCAGSTTAATSKEAQQDLQAWLQRCAQRYPRLTAWVEAQIGETLHVYRLSAPAPQAPEVNQSPRAAQRRDQAPHPCGADLPEPGELPAIDPGAMCRDPRRVARRSPLSEHRVPEGAEERPAAVRGLSWTLASSHSGLPSGGSTTCRRSTSPSEHTHPR